MTIPFFNDVQTDDTPDTRYGFGAREEGVARWEQDGLIYPAVKPAVMHGGTCRPQLATRATPCACSGRIIAVTTAAAQACILAIPMPTGTAVRCVARRREHGTAWEKLLDVS